LILSLQALKSKQNEDPSAFDDISAGTAGLVLGAAAVGALALYKRPRISLKHDKVGVGALFMGGGVQLRGLAGLTARWTRFGAYLDEATRLEAERGAEAITLPRSSDAEK
jgi:hypothetical protein